MKTLFILSNMREYGGAEHSIATLIPHLAEAARVFVFVENERHGAALRKIDSRNLTVVSLPKGNGLAAMIRSLLLLRHCCAAERPDALLANGHKGSLMLCLLQTIIPGPRPRFAVYVRDFDYYTFRRTLWAMRDFQFFAPSQSIFEHPPYLAWGLGRRSCKVLPNAVAMPGQLMAPDEGGERFVGCCARITPWKGIEYLIRAFSQVAVTHPSARLRVYGDVIDRDYFDSLRALSSELGLTERISFLPFTSDLARVFRQGLFFVIPSLSVRPGPESFCRIIIEAWSFSRPVIAFAAGGPLHLIEHGVDGFLVEEGNVDHLAARIRELLENEESRERMGEAGRGKACAEFSPETIARSLLSHLLPRAVDETNVSPAKEMMCVS